MNEEIRIDVIKKATHQMEILVYSGDDLLLKHTIELNPEIFDEEEAERVMSLWAQLIQMQTHAIGMWRNIAEKLYDYLFSNDDENEDKQ